LPKLRLALPRGSESIRSFPEKRRAITHIQDGLKKWKKYTDVSKAIRRDAICALVVLGQCYQ